MSNLTQDFAEEVVAMFCPTTKVKITDGIDGIYLTKTNEIHCGKDWSVSGLLHEIAHAKYYLEENKTGHDGRYADILTKITDEYMSSDISYLYQDSKSKTIRGLADDFLSAHKELERTRKALEQSEICCTEWEKQALDYKAENIALSGDLERTRKMLKIAIGAIETIKYSKKSDAINLRHKANKALIDIYKIKDQTALEQKEG
jgi:hypothetical protein